MLKVVKFSVIVTLLAGMSGCSGPTPEEAAAEARVVAADARVSASDADARVTAADAHVRVADAVVDAANADARVGMPTDVPAKAAVTIPTETQLKVSLIDALDSGTSSGGDRFLASLSESIVVNGVTVLPAGTTLTGRVVDVKSAGRVQGLAMMSLVLTDIVQGDQSIPITTDIFAVNSESTRTRDAEIIAGGAGVGAAIGAIAGGARGAATGGGAGTGVVLATRGEEIQYSPETRLTFTLMNSVSI